MFIQTTIKQSLKNLRAQKMRSFLTMLGIIIGISSIIIITSVVAGAQSLITNQFNSIGSNVIGVLPGGGDEDGPPAAAMGIIITTLQDDDTKAIAKLPHIEAFLPGPCRFGLMELDCIVFDLAEYISLHLHTRFIVQSTFDMLSRHIVNHYKPRDFYNCTVATLYKDHM